MNKIHEIIKENIKEFNYRVGDRVKVHIKVKEGETERIQVFDGIIIAIRGSGPSRSFTIRKISYGVGVERIFPVNSPTIEKIELVRSNKVRRAKLGYIRRLSGKDSRLRAIVEEEAEKDAEIEEKQNEELISNNEKK